MTSRTFGWLDWRMLPFQRSFGLISSGCKQNTTWKTFVVTHVCWSLCPLRTLSSWWFTWTLQMNCCLDLCRFQGTIWVVLFSFSLLELSYGSLFELHQRQMSAVLSGLFHLTFEVVQRVFSVSSVRLCHGDDCRLLDVMSDREEQGFSVQFNVMTHCTPVDAHRVMKAWPTNVKSAFSFVFSSCGAGTISLDI